MPKTKTETPATVAGRTAARGEDALSAEVAALRAEVDQLRAALLEVDGDLLSLEMHVDQDIDFFLRAVRSALQLVFPYVYGKEHLDYRRHGGTIAGIVYRSLGVARQRIYRLPERRWRQFGSAEDVRRMAAEHGVKIRVRQTREYVLRDLHRAGVPLRPSRI